MKVIGLTGGICSGKSTVSQFLAELGAVIIDADKVGHLAFKQGTDAYRDVISVFGNGILSPNGEVDRKKLSEIVFENYEALSRLNKIMHPRIREMVEKLMEENRRVGTAVVVLEATLLVEAGWKPLVDELWVTVASEETALRRLKERSRLSEKEALARIRSQPLPGERKKYADVVIDTNCTFKALKAKVTGLWRRMERT